MSNLRFEHSQPVVANASPSASLEKLEKLPAETRQRIVDFISNHPESLSAFARTNKLGLEHVNKALESLIPHSARVTDNRLGEWMTQFRTLPASLQQALIKTSGMLPLPKIHEPVERAVAHVYLGVATGIEFASQGLATEMSIHIDRAKTYARNLAMEIPAFDDIERSGYAKALELELAAARFFIESANGDITHAEFNSQSEVVNQKIADARHHSSDNHNALSHFMSRVKEYAKQAGVDVPDIRDIEHAYLLHGMRDELAMAGRCKDPAMKQGFLMSAKHWAEAAGVPMPEELSTT